MKHMKKLASVFLALVMAAALAVPAWATAYKENPRLSVSEEGLATGHTYVVYQIFDAKPRTTEDGNLISDASQSSTFVEAFEEDSVEWGYSLPDAQTQQAFIAKLNEKLGLGLETTATALEVAQAIAEKGAGDTENVANAVAEAAKAVPVTGGDDNTRTISSEKNSGGLDVPTGYYLIVETLNGETKNIMHRHVADETISPKITKNPKLEKKVETSANSGKWSSSADYSTSKDGFEGEIEASEVEVNFMITATLPDTFGNQENYTLTFLDRQDETLTMVDGSLKVYHVPASVTGELTKVEDTWKELTPGQTTSNGDYSIEWNTTRDGQNYTFVIDIRNMDTSENPTYGAGDRIVVMYASKLSKDANTSNKNDVWLDYTGSGDDKPHDDVTVYTFELDIDKIDGSTGENDLLSGAEFTLYEWVGADDGDVKDDSNWKAVWTYNVPDGESGTAQFEVTGLKQGKYKLVEDKAPSEAYNQLTEPVYLNVVAEYDKDAVISLSVVECNSDWTAKKTTDSADNAAVKVEVINNKGVLLPETGGIGTTIFYIAGGILAVGAVILLITKRRVSADED